MILIIIIYFIFLVGILATLNYEKEFKQSLNKKEHSLLFLYPLALFLAHFVDDKKSERHKKRVEQIRLLHANEDINEQYKIFMAKKFATVLFCILLFNTLGLFIKLTSEPQSAINEGAIERPSYGEDTKDVDLNVVLNKNGEQVEQKITVNVEARKYTEEEFNQAAESAKEYLNQNILGENISLDKIYYPLKLVKTIPGTALSVLWDLDSKNLIGYDGTINHDELTESQSVTITAKLTSEDYVSEYTMDLIILPKNMSEEDQLLYQLDQKLNEANNDTITEDSMVLPAQVDDYDISYEEPSEDSSKTLLAFGLLVSVLVFLLMERKLVEQKEERDVQIMLDYPELINKFTLLIGAGMTVKKAWEKIVLEYEDKKNAKKTKKRYAYEELKVTLFELNNGMNESKAYENFGRRMQLIPYMKFSALLAQNISKGMDGILQSLELEAVGAFEERKGLAKRLGEKAGTKLLMPMGIMLCLVFVMILIPAFLSF